MAQRGETVSNQNFGVIICKNCDREIESFRSEQVVTQYGICFACNEG